MKKWEDELIVTPQYIQKNIGFIAKSGEVIAGFYSIAYDGKEHLIDMVLVNRQCIGLGVWNILIDHMKAQCKQEGIKQLYIVSDPHAKGFYEKMGAMFKEEIESSKIKGRMLPVLTLKIKD